MSKIKNKIFFALSLLLIFPSAANAIDILNPLSSRGLGIINPIECENLFCFVEIIMNLISLIAYAIAPIMIVIAGYYFMISGGNENKIATAKRIITNTIIALVIILFSRAIVSAVQSVF